MDSSIHDTENHRKALQTSKNIETFLFDGLLPAGRTLTLNRELRILTVLARPCDIAVQSILTRLELVFVETLFAHFPSYTPLEVLHAVYSNMPVEASQEVIARAYRDSRSFEALHPTRNLVNLCRKKLRPLGIEVVDILETGYTLLPYRPRSAFSQEAS